MLLEFTELYIRKSVTGAKFMRILKESKSAKCTSKVPA